MMGYTSQVLVIAGLVIATTLALGIQTGKAASNSFGDAVSSQAKTQTQGSFGAHQSAAARDQIYSDGQRGLGEFNSATCTPLK
jgi:hypothetical protein